MLPRPSPEIIADAISIDVIRDDFHLLGSLAKRRHPVRLERIPFVR